MNPVDLRFRISRLLGREPGVKNVTMNSPTPGNPLVLTATVSDPYSRNPSDKAERRYEITIKEIDA